MSVYTVTWSMLSPPTGDDIVASARTLTQTATSPIDLSAHTSTGDRLYAIDLPEGMEVHTEGHRILGAPTTTQPSTTHNIYCQTAVGDDFWIRIDIEVQAPPGNVYTDVTSWADFLALPECATNHTGQGCIVDLGPDVVIDLGASASIYGRFTGLTSPIVIKSADPANPAMITATGANGWVFAGGVGQVVGNVSFLDVILDRPQPRTGTPINDTVPFNSSATAVIGSAGNAAVGNLSFIRCTVQSDVPNADTREPAGNEMVGVQIITGADQVTVWGCTFKNLFNGVSLVGTNCLAANNTQTESWGDMMRTGTSSGTTTSRYLLSHGNRLYNTTSDGAVRHADGAQMGGGGAGNGTCRDFERRGDLSFGGTEFRELPAIAPWFMTSGGTFYDGDTSQTATTLNRSLYRMRTDAAGSDLTVTLPDIATVPENFELCVQKFSGDETYSVVVERNGATINGLAQDYTIDGTWMAVRFAKIGANWGIQIFGIGIQHGLYQSTGGLDYLQDALVWATMATSGSFAGHSFEVRPINVKVEQVTLARLLPDDVDGDGVVTENDGYSLSAGPQIALRHGSAEPADLTVTRSVAFGISKVPESVPGTLTQTDNDTSQTATNSTTEALFMGEGRQPSTPEEMIWMMQHKPDGALAGTGRGAVGFGPATHGYDFVNNRTRIPGAPLCTGPAVIELSGSTYQIATAPTFDKPGTPTYQWCCNHLPIAGQTGATLTQANAPSGRITLRVALADSERGDCIVESNGFA